VLPDLCCFDWCYSSSIGAVFWTCGLPSSFSRAEEAAAGTGSDCKVYRIYGVVGIIRLLAGESPSPNFTNYELLRIFFFCILLCCLQ
jgi:hypothetical protein